jgi:hypothetical protein
LQFIVSLQLREQFVAVIDCCHDAAMEEPIRRLNRLSLQLEKQFVASLQLREQSVAATGTTIRRVAAMEETIRCHNRLSLQLERQFVASLQLRKQSATATGTTIRRVAAIEGTICRQPQSTVAATGTTIRHVAAMEETVRCHNRLSLQLEKQFVASLRSGQMKRHVTLFAVAFVVN